MSRYRRDGWNAPLSRLDKWQQEALRTLRVVFPTPLTDVHYPEYPSVWNAMVLVTECLQTPHLQDWPAFMATIANAAADRIPSRLARVSHCPYEPPQQPPFPQILSRPPDRVPPDAPTWMEKLLEAERATEVESLAADVREYNEWLERQWMSYKNEWRTRKTTYESVLEFDKNDRRFVQPKEILSEIGASNLATMDWQDFEHLIRELFAREFGTDVRVTQASRDKGVDAVAYDPDPIRGGKFVIQAKRYTNTVDVSAVRDLYGTMMNEGASRGILVTTSSYGRDAYEFAQGKPLSLLNGANLLSLLEKHGYHCRIDLS